MEKIQQATLVLVRIVQIVTVLAQLILLCLTLVYVVITIVNFSMTDNTVIRASFLIIVGIFYSCITIAILAAALFFVVCFLKKFKIHTQILSCRVGCIVMFSNSSYRAIRNIVLLGALMTVILLLYVVAAISIGLFAAATPHIPSLFLNWANISILLLVCIMLRFTKQQQPAKSAKEKPNVILAATTPRQQ